MKSLLSVFLITVLGGTTLSRAQTISSFPHTENFELFPLCGTTCGNACVLTGNWLNVTNDGMDWTVTEGPTATANTGPDTDHNPGTATGNYLYLESSGSCINTTGAFLTPPLNITAVSNFSFDFWYHMLGTTLGTLHVDVSTNNGNSYTDDIITPLDITANSGLWQKKTVNLNSYIGNTIIIRMRGVTGNGGFSDIAVDDFTFYTVYNTDAGISTIDAPTNPVSAGSQNVSVTLSNYGINTLATADIGWSVNGAVQPVYNWAGSLLNGQTASVIIGSYNFTAGASHVKVWTSSPNNTTDQNNTNDTTETTLCTTLSGSYTIGGPLPDYASFIEAIDALNNCGVSGPVVFNVATGSGPYSSQLTFSHVSGSSATNTITFNGNGETITADPTTDDRHVVKLDGAKHFVFDNLKITGTDATYGWGVLLINQADSNIIKNCTIDVSAVTSTATSNSAGIVATSSLTSVSSAGNNASHLTFQNNTIIGGYQGIRLTGAQATKSANHVIAGNTIRDFYSYGIYLADCSNNLVTGNDIHRTNRVSVGTFYGIYLDVRNQQLLIEKNRIHNTHGAASTLTGAANGVYSSGCDAPLGFENKIANNLVYNFNGNGTIYGIYNSSSDGSYYYHNTISFDDAASTGGTTRGFYQTTLAQNIHFKNNIVFIQRAGSGAMHCIYLGSTASTVIANHNAYYIDTAAQNTGYYSGDFNTLSYWQTANSGSYDANSVFGDPLFVNPASDFLPTNGLVDNVGDSVGITTDFAGNTRNLNTPDPGAYEFSPPTVDVSISWVAPVSPTSTGNKTIIVKVTNSIASLPVITDLNLSYTDGVNTFTESFSSLSISPGSSADISFVTQYNITGFVTLTAYINTANGVADAIQSNDTTNQVICPSLSGNYTINKTLATGGTNFNSFTEALAALSSCGIIAAVTFDVTAGSGPYTEQITFTAISGTSNFNTITFNGNNNILSFAPNTANRHILKLDGADYTTFNNLSIIATDLTYGWGVHLINGANHNTFNNCTIDVSAITSIAVGDYAGIVATNSNTSISTNGNNADYTTISNCTIIGGGYAIRFNGNTAPKARGTIISGNTIMDFYSYGIYLTNSDSAQIVGNDISRPNKTNVGAFYGVYLTTGVENTLIERNSIHNTHDSAASPTGLSYPIYFTGADAQLGKENVVVNNLIYNINSNGTIYAIYNSSSDHARYYHNTISLDDSLAATTDDTRGFYQTTTATNIDFRNNIITIKRGGTGSKHCIYLSTATSTVISDNNVLFMDATGGVDNNIGRYGSADFSTFAQWQTANGGAYDQLSVGVNPIYTDADNADFTPQNSAVNNKGGNIGVTVDYDLNPRNTDFPDPGAFEFTPSGLDASITWISPVTPLSGTVQTITINISNTQTIPISNLVLSYTDGNILVTENFNSLSILTGANQNFSFATPYNLSGFASIYASIDSVNHIQDQDRINDTTEVQVLCSALAGNYTINKNLGASSINFISTMEAIDRLTNCGVSGPVVIDVVPGSGPYNEQIIIPQIFGANAINTITLNGNNETLSFSPTTDDRYLIRLDGVKHLFIKDLKIIGTDQTYGYGVHFINSADSNSVTGCTIDISSVTSTVTNNSTGILFSGAHTSTSTDGNNGNYNLISENEIIGGYYGVRINGLPGLHLQANHITNNFVHDFYAYGFYVGDSKNMNITGNDISRANLVSVSTFYGIYLASGNQAISIERNRIHNSHDNASSLTGASYPIYFSSCDAPAGNENRVVNNAIYNINSNGTIYALYNSSSDGVYYYHNTISLDDINSSGGTTRGFYQTTAATNIDFRNNIISIKRSGTGSKHCLYLSSSSSDIISDYNILFTDTATNYIGYFSTTNYAGLSSWKTANSNAYDQNSLFADPIFGSITSGNLTPLNTNINDKGTSVGIAEDINQNPRNLVTPDIGAFEFTPAQVDATVIALLQPGGNTCGSDSVQVTAVITNFGTSTISSIPVTAEITGDFNGTLTGFSSTLANTESDTVSIGTVNLSAGGSVTFTIYTTAPNDGVPSNDTLVVSVGINPVVSAPLLLPYTDTICKNSSTTINIDSDPNLTYYWYDTITGGNQIHEGNSYTTPALASSTTFFAEASSEMIYSIGPENNTIGSGANFVSIGAQGILFDVFSTITLDSVAVYPNDSGTVYIELTDASNVNIINITSVQVNASGTKVTIPVGFTITPGSYRIDANGSTTGGLYRNDSGADYPYEIPGVISITGNTFDPTYYYHFYDWRITTSGCPSSRVAAPVFVNQNDTAVSAFFNYSISGFDVTFTPVDNRINNSYFWDFGDGFTSNIGSIAHQYLNDGIYNACLTVSNLCSQETICEQIVICSDLINDYTYVSSGLSVTFNFFGTGVPSTYLWDFADGSTSNLASPSHNFASAGTYNVSLITENDCGIIDTVTKTVSVCENLVADFSYTQSTPGSLDFSFTDNTSGIPLSYAWDFGDGESSTLSEPVHTYASHNNYTVRLITTNACGISDTVTQSTTTCLAVEADFSATVQSDGITVVISNSSTGTNLNYNWRFGDGSSANTSEPTHTYSTTGTYSITLTAMDACAQTDSLTQSVSIITGISSGQEDFRMSVYPNPGNGEFLIKYVLQYDSEVSIKLLNILGEIIYIHTSNNKQGKHSIFVDLTQFAKGSYLLEFKTGKGIAIEKVLLVQDY